MSDRYNAFTLQLASTLGDQDLLSNRHSLRLRNAEEGEYERTGQTARPYEANPCAYLGLYLRGHQSDHEIEEPPVPSVTQRLLRRMGNVSAQTTQLTGPHDAANAATKTQVKAIRMLPIEALFG
jgi:hypothetical protein